jgi:hypothetical protein
VTEQNAPLKIKQHTLDRSDLHAYRLAASLPQRRR